MALRYSDESVVPQDVVLEEQTRLLYAGMPAAIIINVLLVSILIGLQASVIAAQKLWLWGEIIGTVLLARTILAIAWWHRDGLVHNWAQHWINRFRVATIATGAAWGIGIVLLFPAADIPHQVYLAFVMAGLSAGAIPLLAVDRISIRGFLLTSLLPLIVEFWVEGGPLAVAMSVMGSLYLVSTIVNAQRIGSSFNLNIRLRLEAFNREQVLSHSEDQLNQAQKIAHLGSFVWDPLASRLQWSDECFRIWGLEPQSIAPTYELFRKGIHPEDLEKMEDALQRAMAGGVVYDLEHRVVRPDGAIRYVQSRGEVRFNDAGKTLQVAGTIQDITERKEAEIKWHETLDLLQKVASRVPGVVYQFRMRLDGSFCFPFASDALHDIFGVRPEEVRDDASKVFATVLPEDLPAVIESIKVSARTLTPWWYEARVKVGDGFVRWLYGNSVPQREVDGSVLWHGFITDITERKQIEESLRELNEQLEQKVAMRTADLEQSRLEAERANQAKSEFLATMSHEIRTPMNGVIGMIEVLQQSSLSPAQMEMANIIHDSAFSLLGVINDILDFSKIEAGKLQCEKVPMSVAEVVEEACKTLDALAGKSNVELTLFIDPAIPPQAEGDPGRLRQILLNLTNNAIKFSGGKQKKGKVSVRARLVADDGDRAGVTFQICDNGVGIDEPTLSKLFTAFTQGETGTRRNFGGTGLGLAISKQLVNMMGGEITAQSKLGKGSLFTVQLSFVNLSGQPGRQQMPSRLRGLSCLVLGSATNLPDDLVTYLEYGDALVTRARNAQEGRQWIDNHLPGLCVIVVDRADSSAALVEELRAAARLRKVLDVRFVVIEHNRHRDQREVAPGLVRIDAEVMLKRQFLNAVAIAAGRARESELDAQYRIAVDKLPRLSREDARQQGCLILVAEDNEINQKVFLQQLMLLGLTADVVDNGLEALKLWASGDYGILFADLHMPKMDGYELTAAIRTSEGGKSHMPIIAFTANALKGDEDHCRAVGMDDYLSKPVQLTSLRKMLKQWLPCTTMPDAPEETSVRRYPSSESFDVEVLKQLVGNDAAVIHQFLASFSISADKMAAELRNAWEQGRVDKAGEIAHKLKSSARSVGALALGELCAEMEQAGKAADADGLALLLPKFEQELSAVKQYIESNINV